MSVESSPVLALKSWLLDHGGAFHLNTRFRQDVSGSGVVATENLSADLTVVSCPFDLVITQAVAKEAVLEVLGDSADIQTQGWSERQWISTYLSLHWLVDYAASKSSGDKLLHDRYLDTLPPAENLRTPLHFFPAERDLFKGTNLYGATADREREWRSEWSQCHEVVSQSTALLKEPFAWEKYLTAATYLSSRAFPSSLLSATPTLVHSPSTQPILIPGVDALNHARGQPVSWVVTYPGGKKGSAQGATSEKPKISLVIHTSAVQGQELFNNYGPKPNSELILGYGFSIPRNPDDTIVFKIGGIGGNKWEIGREGRGTEGLWKEVLQLFVGSEEHHATYEDILDASGMLEEMVQTLIQRLPDDQLSNAQELRPEVVTMFNHYLEGQRDILSSLLGFCRAREQDALKMAKDEGIDLILEED